MTPSVRNSLFGLLILTSPLAACAQQAGSTPQASAPAVAGSIAQSSAPQIVTGLPDFTRLVEQVGPGVVNIEAKIGSKQVARRQDADSDAMPDGGDMPEFFRRFFGPDFQMPGPQQGPRGPQRRGTSMGSGFIISPDGYVLTNHHVIDGADEVTVKLSDRRELKAKVIGSDQQYDVALLKIEASNLPSIRLGDSNTLKPGQWVVAIGSPFGLDHSVTAGIVSAIGRSTGSDQRYVPFIQTDVAINPGNSGGPLLNISGEVVGINSQIFSQSGGYMGVSFAIPIDLAMSAVEQLKKTGKVSRGQLGVQVGALTKSLAEGAKAPDTRGALINEVLEGSAAEKAGLEAGDIIRSVDGSEIATSSDLPPRIGAMAPGTKVTLGILRDGKPRDVTVTLSTLEEDANTAASTDAQDDGAPAAPARAESALLGISVADLDAATRKQLGLKSGEGVRITRVYGESASETLRPGIVILQVGRKAVGSVAEFNQALREVKAGQVVMLLVRSPRGGSAFVAITAGDGG